METLGFVDDHLRRHGRNFQKSTSHGGFLNVAVILFDDNKGLLLAQATKNSIASAVWMFANRLLSSTANATTSLPSNPSNVIPT
jgi:hypothetical protein